MSFMDLSPGERIIFRNESCLVINKLPGESSEFPRLEGRVFPVHRLDTPVSGCLLLALNQRAAAFLGAAFAAPGPPGAVEKLYWAIVEKPASGRLLPPEAELLHWLYEDKKANKSFALPWSEIPPVLRGQRGKNLPKKALLRYRIAGTGERYFFLEINLLSGRHHQIRAQLAAAGLHIKGDLKYGAKRSEKGGGIRLHARALSFPNPLDPEEIIRVRALPPAPDTLWTAFMTASTGQGICE